MKHDFTKAGFETKHEQKFQTLVEAIEVATGLKLYARAEGDEVNGYVSAYGDKIEVVIYEKDEPINNVRSSPWKKPGTMPTKSKIQTAINGVNL